MVVEGKGSPVGGAADKKAEETFDWLELRRQLDTDRKSGLGYSDSVSATEKFQRKFRENPLVPAGSLLTTLCLTMGLFAFMSKRSRLSQIMMRGRILAQGVTVGALTFGTLYSIRKTKMS